MRDAIAGADAVLHAATLHKPHVDSHTRQQFVHTNVTGTLTLLEEAVAAGVSRFVFTSTTSAFGRALVPPLGAPAAWIDEDVAPRPKNIYGATKVAAEDLCELIHRDHGLPVLVLRTSRFFPEDDDREEVRAAYPAANAKVNELLYRRADLQDIVDAHRRALERAPALGFGRYIVSATTPFTPVRPGRAAPRRAGRRRPPLPRLPRAVRAAGLVDVPRRSSASTTTRAPAATSAGRRAGTSRWRSSACRPATIRSATWPRRSA